MSEVDAAILIYWVVVCAAWVLWVTWKVLK